MIHDLCFFPAMGILGKTGWLGALVIFTFFRVICFDYKETLTLLIVSPQSSLMIQEQSQQYLCNSICGAITLVWKLGVPQTACEPSTSCNQILCCPSLLLKGKPQGQEKEIWIAAHYFSFFFFLLKYLCHHVLEKNFLLAKTSVLCCEVRVLGKKQGESHCGLLTVFWN